ncbi:MAG: tyrosine-type recombinase/integrase [Acidobacteriota bacterium]
METRKERGLKQLPDGRWQWSYKDPSGRYRRYIARTKGEARAYLEKVHTLIREGRFMDRRKEVKTTFEEAVKRFLVWSEVNVRPSTYKNDKHYAELWLASPHFAGKRLSKITPVDVEAYKAQRVTGPNKVSQRTTDADLGRLRRLFSLCETWGLCEKNPVKAVKFFHPECRRERFLTPEEEALLMDHAPPPMRPCITFAVNTGLRLREMLTLTWSQIDLKQGFVTITAEVAKGKRTRHVPLNQRAREALGELPRNINPAALVFPLYGGEVFGNEHTHSPSFYKAWQKTVATAKADGLDGRDLCWHTLRHTFASRLVAAGVGLHVVQRLLGHQSIAMVMRYAHLGATDMIDAVKLLESKLQFSCNPSQPHQKESAP